MSTAANFRGAIHSGDTAVDLYFNAAGSGVAGAFDKIPLVVTTEKEQEVIRQMLLMRKEGKSYRTISFHITKSTRKKFPLSWTHKIIKRETQQELH
jgi:hypothetical protein